MESIDRDGVQGMLHPPTSQPNGTGVVLTHGAGADFQTLLLVRLAEQMAAHGCAVLRCNLAFRQKRRTGPPHPSHAEDDRRSLGHAVHFLRHYAKGRIILSGHSYGGRQATVAAAENRTLADHLLLFSYPLHPPAKPEQLRTAHFPKLKVPATFIHGAKDSFGSPAAMEQALQLIPAETKLVLLPAAGHDLLKGRFDLFALAGKLT